MGNPENMENGPEPTPRGPIWPNKAQTCILRPIRIHPFASQPLAAPEKKSQALFQPNPAPFSRQIRPNLANSPEGDLDTGQLRPKPPNRFRESCRSPRVSATPPNLSPYIAVRAASRKIQKGRNSIMTHERQGWLGSQGWLAGGQKFKARGQWVVTTWFWGPTSTSYSCLQDMWICGR